MDIHIYFDFKESERKLIALAINGELVGLQTMLFRDKRVYVCILTAYELPGIELTITSMADATSVEIVLENKTSGISISREGFLEPNQKPLKLNIDLEELGPVIPETSPKIEIKDPRPVKFPGKGSGRRAPESFSSSMHPASVRN